MSLTSILAIAIPPPITAPHPSHHPAPAPVSSSSSSNFGIVGCSLLPKTELAEDKLRSIADIRSTEIAG
jgi:hypothetical protein